MSALKDDKPTFDLLGICHTCKHRRATLTCDAFPQRIPTAILTGEHDHRKPYPGDGGIRYEAVKGR